LIYYEIIELLKEICTTLPEVLERAREISIDSKDSDSCKIVIRDNLTEANRNKLLETFANRNLKVIEQSSGVWVIY
jgi:hypothetical protein